MVNQRWSNDPNMVSTRLNHNAGKWLHHLALATSFGSPRGATCGLAVIEVFSASRLAKGDRHMRIRSSLFVLGALVASTGRSQSTTGTAASVVDACSVASAADVEAAFGAKLAKAPGSPHMNGTVSRCDWTGSGGLVMVRTETLDKASFEASMKTVPGGVKAVSGLGESAYFQASANQFFAYKGKTQVSINYAGSAAKVEASEKALLEKIVKKL
jgi:hypothetical protein